MECKGDNETTSQESASAAPAAATATASATAVDRGGGAGNVQNAATTTPSLVLLDDSTQTVGNRILPNTLRRVIYKGGSFILRNYLSEQKRELESEIHLNRRQYRTLLSRTAYRKALVDRATKQLAKVNEDIAAIDARTSRDDDDDDDYDDGQVAAGQVTINSCQEMEMADVVVGQADVEQAALSPSSVQLPVANEAGNEV